MQPLASAEGATRDKSAVPCEAGAVQHRCVSQMAAAARRAARAAVPLKRCRASAGRAPRGSPGLPGRVRTLSGVSPTASQAVRHYASTRRLVGRRRDANARVAAQHAADATRERIRHILISNGRLG